MEHKVYNKPLMRLVYKHTQKLLSMW